MDETTRIAIYTGQLHALLSVWSEQHTLLQQYFAAAAEGGVFERHIVYLEAFDRSVRRNVPPDACENAQQALLAMTTAKIAQIRAVLENSGRDDEFFAEYEAQFKIFSDEWHRLAQRAGIADDSIE